MFISRRKGGRHSIYAETRSSTPAFFPSVFPQLLRNSSSKEGEDYNIIHLKLRAAEIPSSAQFEQTLQPGNFTIANLTKIIVIIKHKSNVKQ